MLKKILSFIIFILVLFTTYLIFNALAFKSKQIEFDPIKDVDIDDSSIYRLAKAIQIKTISHEDPLDFDSAQFDAFNYFLKKTYPIIEQKLIKTTINDYSHLYQWKGQNEKLKPVVLVAHLDVVPVPDEDFPDWKAKPYSGEIKDEILWGRGAMDDKVSVIGILEAVDHLLSQGFLPNRTVYIAFGHDEEVGGQNGAKAIVQHLKQKGIEPEFVIDEGFAITQGLVPGVLTDVALIGIAEKGFVSLTLSVELDGGHSSMPNEETAINVMANAITNLKNNPFPTRISEPVQQFLEHVGPEMRFQEKLVFANNALFRSVILGIYQQTGPGRAVVQTTMAPTVFNSGIKDNVIPAKASATVNFRILPESTIDDVVEHVNNTIEDDRISIEINRFHSNPSKVSSTSSRGYAIINQSIKEVFPDAITVPNLVIAATDGRYYGAICDDVYRFLPIRLNQDNVNAMHGINECIPVEEFEDAIRFYIRLLENCQGL